MTLPRFKTIEQKIDTITGAYSSAKDICKDLFAGEKSTYTADMAKDEIYKVVVSDAQGRKNDAGKTIPGSVKQEKIQRLMDIGVPRNEAVQWLNREN